MVKPMRGVRLMNEFTVVRDAVEKPETDSKFMLRSVSKVLLNTEAAFRPLRIPIVIMVLVVHQNEIFNKRN